MSPLVSLLSLSSLILILGFGLSSCESNIESTLTPGGPDQIFDGVDPVDPVDLSTISFQASDQGKEIRYINDVGLANITSTYLKAGVPGINVNRHALRDNMSPVYLNTVIQILTVACSKVGKRNPGNPEEASPFYDPENPNVPLSIDHLWKKLTHLEVDPDLRDIEQEILNDETLSHEEKAMMLCMVAAGSIQSISTNANWISSDDEN